MGCGSSKDKAKKTHENDDGLQIINKEGEKSAAAFQNDPTNAVSQRKEGDSGNYGKEETGYGEASKTSKPVSKKNKVRFTDVVAHKYVNGEATSASELILSKEVIHPNSLKLLTMMCIT